MKNTYLYHEEDHAAIHERYSAIHITKVNQTEIKFHF